MSCVKGLPNNNPKGPLLLIPGIVIPDIDDGMEISAMVSLKNVYI
jgi:hypothetical protein